MFCPVCKKSLEQSIFQNVEVDYCPQCLGVFFDEDELSTTKDYKDRTLRWLDVDLWKDETKFKLNRGIRNCPSCRLPLYEVYYPDFVEDPRWLRHRDGNSNIIVDVCNLCHGIWLDRGEFKKIIDYLKNKADYEVLNHYLKNLMAEAFEVFSGPEVFREEILDFLTILKLLNYKFAVQHPVLTKIISSLPR